MSSETLTLHSTVEHTAPVPEFGNPLQAEKYLEFVINPLQDHLRQDAERDTLRHVRAVDTILREHFVPKNRAFEYLGVDTLHAWVNEESRENSALGHYDAAVFAFEKERDRAQAALIGKTSDIIEELTDWPWIAIQNVHAQTERMGAVRLVIDAVWHRECRRALHGYKSAFREARWLRLTPKEERRLYGQGRVSGLPGLTADCLSGHPSSIEFQRRKSRLDEITVHAWAVVHQHTLKLRAAYEEVCSQRRVLIRALGIARRRILAENKGAVPRRDL